MVDLDRKSISKAWISIPGSMRQRGSQNGGMGDLRGLETLTKPTSHSAAGNPTTDSFALKVRIATRSGDIRWLPLDDSGLGRFRCEGDHVASQMSLVRVNLHFQRPECSTHMGCRGPKTQPFKLNSEHLACEKSISLRIRWLKAGSIP